MTSRPRTARRLACVALLGLAALEGCMRLHPDTPLTRAARLGDVAGIQALLVAGAPVDQMDSNGLTPLVWAGRSGHVAAVEALLAAGADPDLRDKARNGWTPLIHVIHTRQPEVARLLMARGASAGATAPNGCTPLMMAAGEGDVAIVRELLERGADPGAETLDRTTALTNAVAFGNVEIVKLLLEHAPALRLRNILEDRVALWLSRLLGRDEILRLLERHGAMPEEAAAPSHAG